jgi:hypothetical protein
MGWTTIEYSCGHTEQQQMYGKVREREARAAAIGRTACPACRKAQAEATAQAAGLPQLIGSDKQVAWAAEIRERALRLSSPEVADRLRSETAARWWIDNRDRW